MGTQSPETSRIRERSGGASRSANDPHHLKIARQAGRQRITLPSDLLSGVVRHRPGHPARAKQRVRPPRPGNSDRIPSRRGPSTPRLQTDDAATLRGDPDQAVALPLDAERRQKVAAEYLRHRVLALDKHGVQHEIRAPPFTVHRVA